MTEIYVIACCGHSDPESDARVFRREMRAIVVSNYQSHSKEGYEACFVNRATNSRATRFTFTLTSTASKSRRRRELPSINNPLRGRGRASVPSYYPNANRGLVNSSRAGTARILDCKVQWGMQFSKHIKGALREIRRNPKDADGSPPADWPRSNNININQYETTQQSDMVDRTA